MDEEMRQKLEALDEGRAELVEKYRQRAIAKPGNIDGDLVNWLRLNLHEGRLGSGSMAGEAVDLLWRLEHRIANPADEAARLRLALAFVVYDLYLTPTTHSVSHGAQCAIVDVLGEEAIHALSTGQTIEKWRAVRDTIDDPLLLRQQEAP